MRPGASAGAVVAPSDAPSERRCAPIGAAARVVVPAAARRQSRTLASVDRRDRIRPARAAARRSPTSRPPSTEARERGRRGAAASRAAPAGRPGRGRGQPAVRGGQRRAGGARVRARGRPRRHRHRPGAAGRAAGRRGAAAAWSTCGRGRPGRCWPGCTCSPPGVRAGATSSAARSTRRPGRGWTRWPGWWPAARRRRPLVLAAVVHGELLALRPFAGAVRGGGPRRGPAHPDRQRASTRAGWSRSRSATWRASRSTSARPAPSPPARRTGCGRGCGTTRWRSSGCGRADVGGRGDVDGASG